MKLKMLVLSLLALPLAAAPPRVSSGSVQTLTSLAQAEAMTSGWIGYGIETARGVYPCGCSLNSDNTSISRYDAGDLEPASSRLLLFARLRDKQVDRLRFFSADCNLQANGQTIYWIEDVKPAESIAFLKRVVDSGTERGRDGALLALSMHAGATDTLIDIARRNPSSSVRGKALFWLSQEAGKKAAAALRDAVENDPEEQVRGKAVFGISQLPDDQSIPLLIDLLKHNRSREVRKKAAFWLGQKNDPRALEAIEDILRR